MLLRNYLDAGNRERLYSESARLLAAEDYDDDLSGAWLLGSDARALLVAEGGANSVALLHASALLEGEAPEGPVQLSADTETVDLEHAVDMLGAFRAGLNDARSVGD